MATYISLLQFTEKGASEIRDSVGRAKSFDEAARASGVEIVAKYWTVGEYDGVLIISAENEQRALHWLSELAGRGYVRPKTLQAFSANEFAKILES